MEYRLELWAAGPSLYKYIVWQSRSQVRPQLDQTQAQMNFKTKLKR